MKKKLLSLFISIVIIIGQVSPTNGSSTDFSLKTYYANVLKELGLFIGSGSGFELDRKATRLEGLVMFIRILGEENEALQRGNEPCVFTDVPEWGVPYVNYAYEKGLTIGVGDQKFGSQRLISSKEYCTFLLRGLGYNDQEGDFTWALAINKAVDVGVLPNAYSLVKDSINRGDVVVLSVRALKLNMKGQNLTLGDYLAEKGILVEEDLSKLELKVTPKLYGAIGDGIYDDSQSVSRAISDVASAGGILELSEGIYNLGSKIIKITAPITITGPGKLMNGKLYVTGVNYFEFSVVDTEKFSLIIEKSSNVKIEDSVFKNVTEDVNGFIGVSSTCSNIYISGNEFSDIKYVTLRTAFGCGVKVTAAGAKIDGLRIQNNKFKNIYGPAAIWLGGTNSTYKNIYIESNDIKNTESFGIELFQYNGQLNFSDTYIRDNRLFNIGAIRELSFGNGAGGIYNNLNSGSIYVVGNDIRHVVEVGIEGYYSKVEKNYIEDTGMDQLKHPIKDSAAIYTTGPYVVGNTIVNPGFYGGIHQYSEGVISNKQINDNVIINDFNYWQPNTEYEINDLVVANGNWYRCIKAGTSDTIAPKGTDANIKDGSTMWDYKKPLSQHGIHLNGVKGIEKISILSNSIENFQYALNLSGFNKDILIKDNNYNPGLIKHNYQFLTGYGSRKGENVVVVE